MVTESISDAEICIPGYDMFRVDRGGGVRGGGVIIYTKSVLRGCIYETKSKEGEWVCCRIENSNGNELILGVYYRSEKLHLYRPNVENNKGTRDWITELSRRNMVLMGDMNYRDIDWESNTACSLNGQLMIDCLEDAYLTQHVKENTRGDSCLDLIISKDPDIVQDVQVAEKMGNGDP